MGRSLFPADHSGIAGVLFGLVGLVLFGTVLLLVVDGQLDTGLGGAGSEAAGDGADAEIAGLQKQVALLSETHARRERSRAGIDRLAEAKRDLTRLENESRRLEEQIARERITTIKLEESFAAYRLDYRKHLWALAVGHEIEQLQLPVGKSYYGVTIRSVSALEVKISHASGSATIPVRELPADIVKAYHLSHGEARRLEHARELSKSPAEEETQGSSKENRSPTSRTGRSEPPSKRDPKPGNEARITALQTEAAMLHGQIISLSSQIANARAQAIHGKRRSPPGSLETWSQRVTRLTNLRGQAKARRSIVEGELRRLDPFYRPPIR